MSNMDKDVVYYTIYSIPPELSFCITPLLVGQANAEATGSSTATATLQEVVDWWSRVTYRASEVLVYVKVPSEEHNFIDDRRHLLTHRHFDTSRLPSPWGKLVFRRMNLTVEQVIRGRKKTSFSLSLSPHSLSLSYSLRCRRRSACASR